MILDLYTKAELREHLTAVRAQQNRLNQTAVSWCERGLDTEDPAYRALTASAADLGGLGDEMHAEICRRNVAEDAEASGV
jgi:hypothetical protein